MAIETKLQPRFVVQKIFAVVLCLVLGLWGVYDYLYKIPRQTRISERSEICKAVKTALEADPQADDRTEKVRAAQDLVGAAQAELLSLPSDGTPGREEIIEAIQSIEEQNEQDWFKVLVVFKGALRDAERRTATDAPSQIIQLGFTAAESGVNLTANVPPPGRYDRAVQWMFILCLPFVPYFAWTLFRSRRRQYRLDDDGTLHAPSAEWSRDEIADIEMDRWMSKSVAWVVHTDGRRMKLDDYVYRDMNLVVGAIASARYPDQWDAEARRVGAEPPSDIDPDASDDAPQEPVRETTPQPQPSET